jgi:2-keto-4-pentenoate hydratase/2-oxohepta-3-ene-1,7-dioic acid hydratase in catechol pathway
MRLVRFFVDRWQLGVELDDKVAGLPFDDLSDLLQLPGAFKYLNHIKPNLLAGDEKSFKLYPKSEVRIGAPLVRPPKIICIGLNYLDHVTEGTWKVPKEPVFFSKFNTAIIGPDEPIIIPGISEQIDYEVELGVVIGTGGKNIPKENSLRHVFGYTIFNDVSARDLQVQDGQWIKGKTLDTFAPMGPAVVTADEIDDPQNLKISIKRNGMLVQDARTSQMIFTVAEIISYLSSFFTLQKGDIIATGTPAGTIKGQENPDWLKPGEVLEACIEKIGILRNPIKSEK